MAVLSVCVAGDRANEGTLVTLLGLEPQVLQAVLDQSAPGVSSVRVHAVEEPPPHCRLLDAEAGFVCKKCRVAFSAEAALISHQRACCPGQVGWAVRLLSARYECKVCGVVYDKAADVRRHCDSDAHRALVVTLSAVPSPNLPPPPPPPDSPSTALSHEMEDVVNQIAALAAKAAQEGAAAAPDSNANIRDFCQDGSRKGPGLGPGPAPCPSPFAVPSTGL